MVCELTGKPMSMAVRLRNTSPSAMTTKASTNVRRCFQRPGIRLEAVPNANSNGRVPRPNATMVSPPLSHVAAGGGGQLGRHEAARTA